jgi:ferredoxin-thioredoxin reductase catalytic subunit
MEKKFWRCNVCNDVHYGNLGPIICPTCAAENAYCQIDENEANNIIFGKVTKENQTSKEQIMEWWKTFTEKSQFKLNPDNKIVEMVATGVLRNELKHGLKMCPCRLPDGTRERDLTLICPCNFKLHESWKKRGSCHCNLFHKSKQILR